MSQDDLSPTLGGDHEPKPWAFECSGYNASVKFEQPAAREARLERWRREQERFEAEMARLDARIEENERLMRSLRG